MRVGSALLVLIFLASPAAAERFAECEAWKASVADYDQEVGDILQEPLPRVIGILDEASRKKDGGKRLREHVQWIRKGLKALRQIEPPRDLTAQHARTVDFYELALQVGESTLSDSRQDHLAPRMGEIYRALIAYYEEYAEARVRHGCEGPMTEALLGEVIPAYRQHLELYEQMGTWGQ